ncbi:unnamed protein product [Rhizophagus irregularis]|nr:unnamed protein product [Rhizophagus irregularis]
MTYTNYVDIDWSSASQHSFPQLGDPTPNNDNSDTNFIVTENSEVLSFEDIFFLDIDDIYPFTYSTLHYEESEPDDTYETNNYFDDMLKEALAAPTITLKVISQPSTLPSTFTDTDVTPPSSTISTEINTPKKDKTPSPESLPHFPRADDFSPAPGYDYTLFDPDDFIFNHDTTQTSRL